MLLVYILFSQGMKHFTNLSFCITWPCMQIQRQLFKRKFCVYLDYFFWYIVS